MATNIPPHNLGELVDALSALIHNPEATVDICLLRHAYEYISCLITFYVKSLIAFLCIEEMKRREYKYSKCLFPALIPIL